MLILDEISCIEDHRQVVGCPRQHEGILVKCLKKWAR